MKSTRLVDDVPPGEKSETVYAYCKWNRSRYAGTVSAVLICKGHRLLAVPNWCFFRPRLSCTSHATGPWFRLKEQPRFRSSYTGKVVGRITKWLSCCHYITAGAQEKQPRKPITSIFTVQISDFLLCSQIYITSLVYTFPSVSHLLIHMIFSFFRIRL